ncbi:MAG TPA: hypothetical protein VF136_12145 [Methylomirabilota bacterium]
MPRQLALLALGVLLPATAVAAPGDYLLLHGSVVDKGTTVIVLKGDNGKSYYVSAGSPDQTAVAALRAGESLAVRGVEGAYPNEVKAEGIDLDARRPAWRPASTPLGSTTLSYKDWRLPAGNRYEIYNASAGTYTAVELSSVPGRLEAGEVVYDRTANKWVQHPSVGGRNKAYLEGGEADTGGVLVHGDWRLPRGHRYEVYDSGSSSYRVVDIATLPARLDRREMIFDRTAGKWVQHPSLGGASPYRSARLQGRVQSIEGQALTLTGDDGKPVTVDTSKLKPEAVRALRWSQPVEASGLFDAKRTRFTATDLEPAK